MKESDKETYIAEEDFVVQHSGEIPEVTFHESLYYLTEDAEGPGLLLNCDDLLPLKQAVVKRYRTIILRDLDPQNRDKRIYRGLARCVANWQRMHKFCYREKMDYEVIQNEAAYALKQFLENEVDDVQNGNRRSCINCSHKDINDLACSLGISESDLPEGWQELCPAA